MPEHPLLVEFGQGTSLRRQDYTAAARRAARDALWRNSINLVELFGLDRADMLLDVEIAVQRPDAVDPEAVAEVFPYGRPRIALHHGGLDVPRPDGGVTVIAQAAIRVSLAMRPA